MRTTAITAISAIVSLALLSGCVNAPRRPAVSQDALRTGAVAYFSTAARQDCTVHEVFLAVGNESDAKNLKSANAQFFVNNRYIEKDFPESRGLLHAVALPAGAYALWFEQRHPMLIVDYEQAFPAFELRQGEVRYLGEIQVDGCLNIAVNVGDQAERDTAKLFLLHPELDGSPVNTDLLKLEQGS